MVGEIIYKWVPVGCERIKMRASGDERETGTETSENQPSISRCIVLVEAPHQLWIWSDRLGANRYRLSLSQKAASWLSNSVPAGTLSPYLFARGPPLFIWVRFPNHAAALPLYGWIYSNVTLNLCTKSLIEHRKCLYEPIRRRHVNGLCHIINVECLNEMFD